MATIRSYIFIDQLQPKTMCYLGSFIRGFLPRVSMAALVVEVAPGLEIENITDIAVKNVDVKPGLLVVERQYGYLELHANSTSSVKAAGQAILDYLGASEAEAMRPEILASRIVKRVDNYHAFLINRNKAGSMILAGETLFVLEMQPAAYAILACTDAAFADRHGVFAGVGWVLTFLRRPLRFETIKPQCAVRHAVQVGVLERRGRSGAAARTAGPECPGR